MTLKTLIACTVFAGQAALAPAQSITAEAVLNTGYSTDDVAVGAVQTRAFGDLKSGIRYLVEAAWGRTSGDEHDSDSFGTAYPYANRVQIIEAYGERLFRPHGGIASVRAGRFRTPFGISSASDHAYLGFTRAPLIRYDGYFALSNNDLEHGAGVTAGLPNLNVEIALGAPADVGGQPRRSGLDSTVRVQGYYGPLIVGVSHIRTLPSQALQFAKGPADFTGVDARFTRDGVQVRGEWITGQPFDTTTTTGGYADLILHRQFMGPVTAVARVERLDYETPLKTFDRYMRRQTVGARVRVIAPLSVSVNVIHQTGVNDEYGASALDAGLTWSFRSR
jgi:hypothetical protein